MSERYDAIVIGAGHNGLVCAALLGKAGKKVLVIEANEQVGGAAVTREFADGYSVSACAHLLYQLQPHVVKDLCLKFKVAAENLGTIALAADGNHVRINGNEVFGVSDEDAASYREFHKRMTRFSDLLKTYLNRTPPRLAKDASKADMLNLAQLGFDVRRLGRTEMQEFLRLIGMNIRDELVERFDSGPLRGALSLDAVLGTHLGPRSPNTILTYLYRLAGQHGTLSQPEGGMSAVSNALAQSARDNGAVIRTGMSAKRIVVEGGEVTGVETHSGETFASSLVVSNADPVSTMMCLVGVKNIETGFTRRVSHIRMKGNAAKLHLALDGLPSIDGVDKREFGDRFVIAPDEAYVERAFNHAKYGETSLKPAFEISFPSFRDADLAPAGKHVMSAIVQYAPYELREGWSDATRASFESLAIETLTEYMPDLGGRITSTELLTPADIEEQFHINGGHWHHGELTLDQFLFTRPVGGAQQYKMPVDGLYLCGAGTHPGGGVSGAPGRNAARAILKQEKSA
ncbi:MAG: phytoene desaturase family protein [Woeseiaceae bacterium]